MPKSKTSKALKSLYGARDAEVGTARPQEIFTPTELVRPPLEFWEGIDLDPCAHRDSPVSALARECWYGEPYEWDDKGVATAWHGPRKTQAWPEHTYCNPPFGELKEWLAHAGQQQSRAILCPARLQRPWLRDYMKLPDTVTVALNSVNFYGYKQSFPQALLMIVTGWSAARIGALYEEMELGGVL